MKDALSLAREHFVTAIALLTCAQPRLREAREHHAEGKACLNAAGADRAPSPELEELAALERRVYAVLTHLTQVSRA